MASSIDRQACKTNGELRNLEIGSQREKRRHRDKGGKEISKKVAQTRVGCDKCTRRAMGDEERGGGVLRSRTCARRCIV